MPCILAIRLYKKYDFLEVIEKGTLKSLVILP